MVWRKPAAWGPPSGKSRFSQQASPGLSVPVGKHTETHCDLWLWMQICPGVLMPAEAKGQPQVYFSITLHVSSSGLIDSARLPPVTSRYPPVFVSRPESIGTHTIACDFVHGYWGSGLRSLCLHRWHFANRTTSAAPSKSLKQGGPVILKLLFRKVHLCPQPGRPCGSLSEPEAAGDG